MAAREPSWWYAQPGWQSFLLSPFSALYGFIAKRRMRSPAAYRSRLPVICIGNFTAGGSGKTPTAIALASVLRRSGRAPYFLSRGYGGSLAGPVVVDRRDHTAAEVGDEPLLLARHAPTIVARDRGAGARTIELSAPENAVIIMDDGLQSPALAKDVSFALVDRRRGLGNSRVIPSGPLRARLQGQLEHVDAIIITGSNEGSAAQPPIEHGTKPLLRAATLPASESERFAGRKVIAYAGIANPDRFFAMLEHLGAVVLTRHVFADHHPFSDSDVEDLMDEAAARHATLVTTEKDAARLSDDGLQAELKSCSEILAIEVRFSSEDLGTLQKLIAKGIAAHSAALLRSSR